MVYLLFFLSGCAALVYEIAWSRMLGLLFGHTVYAAAVVLAAYFAGMALGNRIAGGMTSRLKSPLAAYGIAEIIVALWALATPFIFSLLKQPAVASLLNSDVFALQITVRAVVTFLILLPATVALGSTLPFIAEYVSPKLSPMPARINLAYSMNTAGAFAGVMLATYILILQLGVSGGNLFAAGLSALCGLAALTIAHFEYHGSKPASNKDEGAAGETVQDKPRALPVSWTVLAGLSGFGALAVQVLYTRMFALTFHNSTYTFGSIVAVFLISLSLGSWFVSRYGSRFNPRPHAVWFSAIGGLLILASVALFQNYTKLGYFKINERILDMLGSGPDFLSYIIGAFIFVAIVVLPPVALLGTVLPYCFAVASRGGNAGRHVGRLTAINTISAAAGALIASFAMLPLLGLWKSFALLSVLYVAVAAVILLADKSVKRNALLAGATALLCAFGAGYITGWPIAIVRSNQTLEYASESAYGIISVVDYKDHIDRVLKQNNHYTLGSSNSHYGEQRQGLIPLLLHPEPKRICYMGLATGSTASSAKHIASVEHADVVELIPDVVEAARFFEDDYGGLDPGLFNIAINDARHFLYAAEEDYDVIVSDLFVPWHSQTGYLYTVEHYRASHARLADDGIFCQWLPFYQLSERELKMIADSFASVFPHTTLWLDDLSHQSHVLALVGSNEPLVLNGSELQERYSMLPGKVRGAGDFRNIKSLMSRYAGDWPLSGTIVLNTDDHPRVEFLAPKSQRDRTLLTENNYKHYMQTIIENLPREDVQYVPRAGEPSQAFPKMVLDN